MAAPSTPQTERDGSVLDTVLAAYIEKYRSAVDIASQEGLPLDLVRDVIRMVDRAEYKRQQAAPGLKISPKAFGYGRRLPIAAKCRPGLPWCGCGAAEPRPRWSSSGDRTRDPSPAPSPRSVAR